MTRADAIPRLRVALAPLGSASALSARVGLIIFPLGIAATLIGEMAQHNGHPVPWGMAAALAQTALLATLLVGRRLLCRAGPPDPLAVLAAFAVAGIVRGLTFGAAAFAVGALDHVDLPYRIAGFAFTATFLVFVASPLAQHDRHRALVADLEGGRLRLAERERSLAADLTHAQAELSGAVRASIDPALRSIDEALAAISPATGGRGVVLGLERLIEEDVRPLSRRLAESEPRPADSVDTSAARPAGRVPIPRTMPIRAGFRPVVVATGFAVVAIPSAIRDVDVTALPFCLAAIWLGIWLVLATARHLVGGAIRPVAVAAAASIGVHAMAGGVMPILLPALGLPFPDGITPIAVALTGVFAGTTLVLSYLVTARRARTEEELREVNDRLARAVAIIRRRRALVARRLAFVLHGSLQGKLHAAAIRLREAEAPDGALVAGIRAEIDRARRRLEADPTTETRRQTATTIDEIVGVWSGVRSVQATMEPGAELALDGYPDADSAVAEVIREAVNNAIRHGAARTVEIRVTPNRVGSGAPDTLTVIVRDDGIGLAAPGRTGLGTRLFDELCTWWRHVDTGRGTVFEAEIARG